MTLLLAPAALGEGTRTWQRTRFEDFEKGEAKGVAIASDGALLLAPALQPLATTPSAYLWAIATGADGSVYAAAGSPARVYRIAPDGQLTTIFAPSELLVQALAVSKSGAVFAATAPDGKVYKIERRKSPPPADVKPAEGVDPNFTSSVFFDPKSKYIWDLKLDSEERLYVATGDRGELYRVNPDGTGSVFFDSDETHIRTLALDAKGNILAGSDPSGLIYRITPAGEAFVLYSAPRKEITALAVDPAGNIYAAGVGQKAPAAQPTRMPQAPVPGMVIGGTAGGVVGSTIISLPAPAGLAPIPAGMPFGQAAGSDVYRIAAEGAPRRIWNSSEDLVYCLAFDASGRLLAGTGNKGRVFALSENGDFTDLLQASAAQVTGLATASGGRMVAATSNLGKVFVLGGARAASAEASYESDVFDAGNFSRWGRAEVRGAGSFDFFVRSGNVENPSRNWSPWKKVDLARGAAVDAPSARFLQWKVVLRAGEPAARVESVTMNYRPQNVPPSVDEVVVQVGARFPPVVRPPVEQVPVVVGGDSNPPPQVNLAPGALRDSDSVAVRWNAHDDNNDDLTYSVYYRGDGETRWKLLKDKITDKFYSFDRDLLPDGGYTMKVVASDSPSNPADEALSDDKESARFELDSAPPVIEGLSASVNAGKVHVTFRATDTFSPIAHAEYSLDAGDWQVLEPVGRISDSKTESYDFTAAVPPAAAPAGADENLAEHIVVVRVYDRYDNVGSGKTVVRGK